MRVSRAFRAAGAAFGTVALLGLAGCGGEEGEGEKAGRQLDQAAEDAANKAEEMKKQLEGK